MDFSQTFISTSPMYALHIIPFSACKKHLNSFDRLLDFRLTVTITWTPSYDLHKISDTQSILMYHSVLKVKKIAGLSFSILRFQSSICFICLHIIAICYQETSWVQKLKVSCHNLFIIIRIFCF